MWSLIVFSDECEFKDVTVSPDTRFKVIQLHELKRLISNIIKTTEEDIFTESQVQTMYDQLYSYTQVDEETKIRSHQCRKIANEIDSSEYHLLFSTYHSRMNLCAD